MGLSGRYLEYWLDETLQDTRQDDNLYDAAHLAQLIAALGPPTPEFLARNPKRTADLWGAQVNWLGLVPIPDSRIMEVLKIRMQNKSGFLRRI
ncbi:hypothetical protein EYZ11_004706 [Aspergillus tanneri]|uniref:Uncharacterized protein n=1 Tax=Aspergillus tanneri TaxID=1220188 RepID=A0A4S3JJU4_9EURO|nr:hypothetical protein EYZ11_004706 [Aspergillus tanneri]